MITGTAGVGKTALAVRWAHAARDRYPDGQLYVNLRGFDADDEPLTPTAALTQLLRALGATPSETDDQSGLYRSLLADRKALVVLDNARDAAQVLPLLPSTGRVLVTSRNRLGDLVARTGARSLALTQLPSDDSRALLVSALGTDRVAAEPVAATELAEVCGHHPLALRIAAANVDTSIAATVAELRADPLARRSTAPSRARSRPRSPCRTGRLPADQKQLFRLLGTGAGTGLHAARGGRVARRADRGRRLDCCAAWRRRTSSRRTSPGRYRFHDLVRRYAEDARATSLAGRGTGCSRATSRPPTPRLPTWPSGS